MVLTDILGPGRRRLVRQWLDILRDFDIIHTNKLKKGKYGEVDFIKQVIRIKNHGKIEDDNSLLHELRHIFQLFYKLNPQGPADELEAEAGAIMWYKKMYERLE
jgi:hypothetical protein